MWNAQNNYKLRITNRMTKIKNGFTLFELLVSISIIAILTALAIVSYSSAQKRQEIHGDRKIFK